jgi:hypothetical protein
MADTIFYPLEWGKLVNDFGSEYPAVLAALQSTTREQGNALMKKDAEPLRIPTSKGIALFGSRAGSAHNPTTDVKEYGVRYIGLAE